MNNKKIVLSDILSFSFRALIDHISLFFGTMVFYTLGVLAGFIVAALTLIPVWNIPLGIKGNQIVPSIVVALVIPFTLLLFFKALSLGCEKIALNVYDQKTTYPSTIFSCFGIAVYGIIAWFLYCFMATIGFFLLIIPSFIVLVRFMFFSYIIIDKGVGPIRALGMSWNLTKDNFWDLCVLWIVLHVLVTIGYLTFIGWLLTWPLSILAYAAVYRQLTVADNSTATAAGLNTAE